MGKLQILMRMIASRIALKGFELWEALGVHVTPDHYYYPIPSTKDLTDDLFQTQSDCIGVNMNREIQEEYLNEIFPKFALEVEFEKNTGLSLVDAAILHAMVRHHRPKQIIEIGSGASTQFAARACVMNQKEGNDCELVAIDPYPNDEVRNGFPGLSKLINRKIQSVDVREFQNCDLLFIDSSHVVKIGGDVNYEILEIIPRLKVGCLIHFHDILLPGEYWKEWVKGGRLFWTEQYLLQAFLAFNRDFDILWASRYMHLKNAPGIKAIFPYFEPDKHHIMSFWLRRKN